ncbi:rRNA SAM-dependent methyltransferase RmsB [Alkalihalophilus pseudofirmus OF4]|uniref:16S rRNA (cytosine(967)-C(5))-methyltransferase n=1 Tax=Alkalihalophilus pseudofirmus (strain ATCC BAA-2126 / JCM 17055 / OF4) TaxID=398511 RepID=D3FT88_ALKPO|nr:MULTISPECIES: 16S rRNA (cytosine(967)-C(5))-methyltransferase RsmB [Alkalihalophilus]ADC48156.1 rRNA SAM-dependent methyltransferase RmsB [Alkalihalophilus pseudofirmus OF4]MED1602237.1 16S rRNA (cytosine(967)-C(5))-methyltransferase RsmB [Alkalihalophilus marmarensis]
MSKNVREVAVDVLLQIEKNQAYSNLLLNQTINKSKLDRRDIGLLTELVYGTIQRRDTLDYFLAPFVKKGIDKLEDWVKVLLRLSVYQLVYLDRIPDRAVVHEAVTIAKKRGHKGISGMVNGVLRSIGREGVPDIKNEKDPIKRLALETSHPKWLVARWVKQFGEEDTRLMCEENLVSPAVTVRVNQTKATREEVISMLEADGIAAVKGELSEDALIIKSGQVFESKAFKQGYVTAQDESSMLVGRALGANSGERVADVCAAPGGKTTHIAEQMNNEGSVLAFDLHDHKVKLIRGQAARLDLSIIDTQAADARKLAEKFEPESFDRILVDAPCSGFGVIKRKPDIKWAKKEADIKAIQSIQQAILNAVAPLLKKGGTLVYSTCTVDKDENEETVEAFLAEHPSFVKDEDLKNRLPKQVIDSKRFKSGMVTILPQDFNSDGFFISSLVKQ